MKHAHRAVCDRAPGPPRPPSAAVQERIHALWDELADFGAAQVEEARDHLLAGLCALVDAQNANWHGTVRVGEARPEDPVRGWRSRVIHFLRPARKLDVKAREQQRGVEQGRVDTNVLRLVDGAGRFRVCRLVDLVGAAWFKGDYYRDYYLGMDRADAVWTGIPINEDAELYIGVFRDAAHPRFTAAERDAVGAALRGLRWFHRQQMLAEGLAVAQAPLTPQERRVLCGLLAGLTEKEIARQNGQSPKTTHVHVTHIFRKFGVTGRAGLAALWLGKGA